jgi:protein-S-isoprenylcysteine O-methyltransferase Ste14
LPNWRKSSYLVAGIANAALVCFPALAVSGGHVPLCAPLSIVVAAVCEGVATSPQRVNSSGKDSGLVTLWNVAHGVAVLICLQSFTMISTTSATGGERGSAVGAIFLISGIALRTSAIRALGEHFTDGFAPSAGRRVIAGPYRLVRHPAELGLLLTIAGFGTLVCGWSIGTAALFAFLTAVSTVRIIAEDRSLQSLAENDPAAELGHRSFCGCIRRHAVHGALRNTRITTASGLIHTYWGNDYL